MTTKLRCLLLDDEIPGLTYLKMLCEQVPGLEVVKAFNQSSVFMSELPELDFDLCILDIEMPGMDGLSVAGLLSGKPIIFTTAYKEYAATAFELNAIDYLVKPLKKDRLIQAVRKVQTWVGQQQPRSFLQVNSNKGKAIVFFDQILMIQISPDESRDKIVWLKDGSKLTIKNISFSKLKQDLPDHLFCQINKQEMIHLHVVRFFVQDEIATTIMETPNRPITLRLSDLFRKEFLQKVSN